MGIALARTNSFRACLHGIQLPANAVETVDNEHTIPIGVGERRHHLRSSTLAARVHRHDLEVISPFVGVKSMKGIAAGCCPGDEGPAVVTIAIGGTINAIARGRIAVVGICHWGRPRHRDATSSDRFGANVGNLPRQHGNRRRSPIDRIEILHDTLVSGAGKCVAYLRVPQHFGVLSIIVESRFDDGRIKFIIDPIIVDFAEFDVGAIQSDGTPSILPVVFKLPVLGDQIVIHFQAQRVGQEKLVGGGRIGVVVAVV